MNTVNSLTTSEVVDFLKNEQGVLIDTLVPEHYEARHIPGAVSACVFEVVFLDLIGEAVRNKDTPIVVYGAGGDAFDVTVAADKLRRAGYAEVSTYPGGLNAWLDAGYRLEGTAPDIVEAPDPILEMETKVYNILPAESVITWIGRNNNGGHTGSLELVSGQLDNTKALSASFTLDMNSIRNTNLAGDDLQPVLESHLKSDDFFFTKLFPEAVFMTTKICVTEDGESTRPNAMIQGVLSLRGASNEIAFPAHIRNVEDGKLALIGNLDFDRTQWGVIYGSSRFFKHLGFHVVFDFISIDFRLVLE
jgi:rhodanese-related sulfurtransferase/polyisoprenoid-binding protein YceI